MIDDHLRNQIEERLEAAETYIEEVRGELNREHRDVAMERARQGEAEVAAARKLISGTGAVG